MLSIYQIMLLLVDPVCPIFHTLPPFPLALYALHLSNYAAPSGPGMPNFLLLDPLLVINYREKYQCEEEGEEAHMSIFQLAADYYCGDLCFFECFITIIWNWGVVFVVYFLFIL